MAIERKMAIEGHVSWGQWIGDKALITVTLLRIMHGTSASNLNKLQVVQNALARTVSRSPLSVSASHRLSNLHWFPVRKRIDFKIATLTYKVLSTQQPAYLHNLIIINLAVSSVPLVSFFLKFLELKPSLVVEPSLLLPCFAPNME